jgi:hypothetical protein
MTVGRTLEAALGLITGDRAKQHGDYELNHANIAALWNAYLRIRREPGAELTPADVALMMALLKVARTQLGGFNPDDYCDAAAYLDLARELAHE